MKVNRFLQTEHFFLDSSIFEEQNFLNSTKLHSFFHYAKTGAIKIHVTAISKMELYNRIDKRIAESRAEMKKIIRGFNGKNARVIKNIGFYESIKIPDVDIDKHSRELKKKIDAFFKRANVNTIRTTNLPITDLVGDYYKKRPPFHNSGKQNEFIDAFILKTLDIWCERHSEKMYVLSKDPDFLGYKSDNLIMENNLSSMLENITLFFNRHYKLSRVTAIKRLILKQKNDLQLIATDLIKEKVTITSKDFDISTFEVNKIDLDSNRIISISQGLTEIECLFKCTLRFFVYDEVDHYDTHPKPETLEIEVPIFFEISENNKFDIKWLLEISDYVYTSR